MTISDIHQTELLSVSDDQLKMLAVFARNTYLSSLDDLDPQDDIFLFEFAHLSELRNSLACVGKYLWDDPLYYLPDTTDVSQLQSWDIQSSETIQCLVAAARTSWHATHRLLETFEVYSSLKVYRKPAACFFEKV